MRNTKNNKKIKSGKVLIIFFIILVSLFFFRNKIGVINNVINNVIEEMNFKFIKVKNGLYVKKLNYISKYNDIKYLDIYLEKNKKRDAELQKLKMQNVELANLRLENANLRNMLSMKEYYNSEYIAADVSFVEKFSNTERIFIDKGSNDGIKLNLPVLYNGFLIGKISKIGNEYSEVMLLTNKNSKISVILNDKDTQILRGNGNGTFSIFNYNEPVKEGEFFRIETSGVSDLFLKGISVGNFQIKDLALFNQVKEMRFRPSYKIFEIKNVLVYNWNRENDSINDIKKVINNEK